MPPPADPAGLALDACGVLNLAGAGLELQAVASVLGLQFVLVEQVVAEALWIEDVVEGELIRSPVEVIASVGPRVQIGTLTEAELEAFVALATEVDDGEAATLALARGRSLTVLTDDRKARSVAARLDVPVLGTAELLRQWTERQRLLPAEIGALLDRVERRARFSPRRDDPQRAWWSSHVPTK